MGEETTRRDLANLTDREFRAKVSYEVRTVTSSILGTTSLMLETKLSIEQAEYLQILKSSVGQLMIIIDDFLARNADL